MSHAGAEALSSERYVAESGGWSRSSRLDLVRQHLDDAEQGPHSVAVAHMLMARAALTEAIEAVRPLPP